MTKNIVLFSDGTGNSSAKLFKTNVWRTYQALDLSPGSGQIAYYDDGVGTSAFRPLAALGGAVGYGLARNVRELYAFVCRNYAAGDRIYMFGFSRGAFTIRIVNGLIASQGIVRGFDGERDLRRKVRWAYRKYREKYPTPPLVPPLRKLRDWGLSILELGKTAYDKNGNYPSYHPEKAKDGVKVEFLGLWDTVAAYGLPTDEMTLGWDRWIWPLSMSDRDLWCGVGKACHALSLDDERDTFHPVLWNEVPVEAGPDDEVLKRRQAGSQYTRQDTSHIDEEGLTQVWFAGVHANVGGGYPDDSLAHVPLLWIMRQARDKGLRFRARAFAEIARRADALGPVYDSRGGFASYYRYQPRKLARLIDDVKPVFDMWKRRDLTSNVVKIERPKIHRSVLDKIQKDGNGYRPFVLPKRYAVVDDDGSIVEPNGWPRPFFETAEQAGARETIQERVWDLVWGRRIAYFTALFFTFLLAALPWMKGLWPLNDFPLLNRVTDGDKCVDSLFCFAAGLPKLAGGFLPGFASTWVDAFSNNPGVFAVLATILAGLLYAGGVIDAAIKDRMHGIWKTQPSTVEPGLGHSPLHALREHRWYRGFFRVLKLRILPSIFGAGALAAIVCLPIVGASRIWFSLADARGKFCTPSETTIPVEAPVSPRNEAGEERFFRTSEPCWASGLHLREGARYRITLQTIEEPWCDADTAADLTGNLESLPIGARLLGWPLKRYIGENYLKPVARIGLRNPGGTVRGQDEYVLDPGTPGALGERTGVLVSEITAHFSGELFLFVNDAVALFEPDLVWGTYANNRGAARVVVERVTADARSAGLPPAAPLLSCRGGR